MLEERLAGRIEELNGELRKLVSDASRSGIEKAENELRELTSEIERVWNRSLRCVTMRRGGRVATCPDGYIVTGCSAGGNRGSITHELTRCVTHDHDTDWTDARCCSLTNVNLL